RELSCFVAPGAAKPADSKTTDLTPAVAAVRPFTPHFWIARIDPVRERLQVLSGLHRPAYFAQGPP
ncbi:MAG TPA: hypothetical protein VMV94_03070, partial [Phycisphaerae bacterium]|nr:hypothetical protein [Phycisphaerae bacterium]